MLKPSYAELMEIMNKDSESDVTSRYTVVIATAKRARQLIDGDDPLIDASSYDGKPVSIAVEEIREGKIKVVPEGQGTVIKPKKSVEDAIKEELNAKTVNIDSEEQNNNKSDDIDEITEEDLTEE